MTSLKAFRRLCVLSVLSVALGAAVAPATAATLVIAATKTPGGFDGDALKPNTQNVVVQVYEGLTKYGYKKNEKTGNKPPEASQRKRQKGQRNRLQTRKQVNR